MEPLSATRFAMIAVGSSAQLLELPRLRLMISQPASCALIKAWITKSLDVAPSQPKILQAPKVTSGATPVKFYHAWVNVCIHCIDWAILTNSLSLAAIIPATCVPWPVDLSVKGQFICSSTQGSPYRFPLHRYLKESLAVFSIADLAS